VLQKDLRAAGPGATVAYVQASVGVPVEPSLGVHPDYWKPEGGELIAYGAGHDRVSFTLPRAATYEVWVEGTIGRPIGFLVDGRHLGTVAYEERYPNQFLHVGAIELAAGHHTLEIVRGGGSLHPGSGDDVDPDTRGLGPVIFLPQGSQRYQVDVASASAAAKICAAPVGYEWMEVLRPGADSAQL
jgi:hypothetical protein